MVWRYIKSVIIIIIIVPRWLVAERSIFYDIALPVNTLFFSDR